MKIMILIPAFCPDNSLEGYVMELCAAGAAVTVVDDGSGESYREVFRRIALIKGCTVLAHPKNLGKGEAIKTGLGFFSRLADRKTYAGVITADADGQHTVGDVLKIAREMKNEPRLILGVRDFSGDDIPPKSRVGNRLTRRLFKTLYSLSLTDTQTGLRGCPECLTDRLLEIKGSRYEYEMNVLIECAVKKIPITEIPIQTVYTDGNSGTHFRPVRDSLKIYGLFFGTFAEFALSSALAAVIDILLFTLLMHFVFGVGSSAEYIFAATAAARVVSSVCNYFFNRKIVFASHGRAISQALKYYLLAVIQMLLSALLVSLLSRIAPTLPSVCKIVVDLVLFFCSYIIQKRFVFN